jgi:hypothetical protein
MVRNGNRARRGAADSVGINNAAKSNRLAPTTQDRPRRVATPAERQQAREVARFVHARAAAGQPLVMTLALVAREFPNIRLETALTGWVFRRLLAPELDERGDRA